MIDVTCFDSYGEVVTALTQWDINQVLQIKNSGITSNNAPKFHFCNKNSSEALVVAPSVIDATNDVIKVEIPNELLQQAIPLIVYLYAYSDKTEYHGMSRAVIKIPIRPRPKPSDYVYETNVYVISVVKLKAEVDEMKSVFEENIATIQTNLSAEIQNRETADNALGNRITTETAEREKQYGTLNNRIITLISADTSLQNQINTEVSTRTNEISALDKRVESVEEQAHTHDNKSSLDTITDERMLRWDTNTDFAEFKDYISDVIGGMLDEITELKRASGINAYDGGLFTQETSDDDALDGGSFKDDSLEAFDCGEF